MADNVTLNVGTLGDVIGADDISSVKYQRVKLIHGADGANDGDVSNTNPIPVTSREVVGAFSSFTATTDTQILASNTSRESARLFNDADQDVLVAEGFATTTSNFTIRIPPKGFYATNFKGEIKGLFVSAVGGSSLKVTSVTYS